MSGGCDALLMGDDPGNLPWDSLREQDWNSLGGLGDEGLMEGSLWDSAGDSLVSSDQHACDGLETERSGMQSKHWKQFSPTTIDAQFDCFWDNFPGQGLDSAAHDEPRNLHDHESEPLGASAILPQMPGYKPTTSGPKQRASAAGGAGASRSPRSSKVMSRPLAGGEPALPDPHVSSASHPRAGSCPGMQPQKARAWDGMLNPRVDAEMHHEVAQPAADGSYVARVHDKDMLVSPLFIVAITDGRLALDIASKQRATLEQIHRKVYKEQMAVVQIPSAGVSIELKMRVLAAASPEAAAINEYMAMHPSQSPAPFVLLHSCLHVGVSLDTMQQGDPAAAGNMDRLRKKIKVHAVKVIRDAIGDARCHVSAAALLGHQGARAATMHLSGIADERMTALGSGQVMVPPGVPELCRLAIAPTKKPRAPREESSKHALGAATISGSALHGAQSCRPCASSATAPLPIGRMGSLQPGSHVHTTAGAGSARGPTSPELSLPPTPRGHSEVGGDDEIASSVGDVGPAPPPRLSAFFPVNLFVTAIADGQISGDTLPKVSERLGLIVRKVPKEQNTSVDIADGGGSVPLQMRVFVVNSEDAKAVGEYINGHMNQVPAPFVVLAWHLPMAVLYDPQSLDLSDASVADRLRKQAKTRAVKVLREAIGNKVHGITMKMLRGHEGATALAVRLRDALGSLLQEVNEDVTAGNAGSAASAANGNKYVVFSARNKAASVPNSPRKRRAGGCASPHDMPVLGDEGEAREAIAQLASGGGVAGSVAGYGGGGGWGQGGLGGGKGGGAKRGGAGSASSLHRNILDRSLAIKRHKKEDFELSPVEHCES